MNDQQRPPGFGDHPISTDNTNTNRNRPLSDYIPDASGRIPPATPVNPPPPPMGYPRGTGYFPPPMQDTSVMSTSDWLVTFLVLMIPCVNIIMLFIWGFSGTGNLNRRNAARAYLILYAIIFALVIIFYVVLFLFIWGAIVRW